ncbi:hypothetical protein M8J76_016449 [Diaphorina citri]|nr:hypothetical protein M8J76_016449 [Diaphorina citri]
MFPTKLSQPPEVTSETDSKIPKELKHYDDYKHQHYNCHRLESAYTEIIKNCCVIIKQYVRQRNTTRDHQEAYGFLRNLWFFSRNTHVTHEEFHPLPATYMCPPCTPTTCYFLHWICALSYLVN